MTRIHKRKNILITILLAWICFIAGIFCVFQGKRTPISASADTISTTNEGEFEFIPGAQPGWGSLDIYRLRFTLGIKEGAFDDDDMIVVLFGDEDPNTWNSSQMIKNGSSFIPGKSSGTTKQANVLYSEIEDLTFTDGVALFHAAVQMQPTENVYLRAYVYADGKTSGTPIAWAMSSTRSVVQVWTAVLADDDPATVAEVDKNRELMESVVAFYNNTDESAFTLDEDYALLSLSSGQGIFLNIPQEYIDQVNAAPTEEIRSESWVISYKDVYDYRLVITRSTTPSAHGSILEIENTDELTHYVYGAGDSILQGFGSSTKGVVYIPIPEASETTYYYFASIVRYEKLMYKVPFSDWATLSITTGIRATSDNYYTASVQGVAATILTKNTTLPENETAWLNDVGGISENTEQAEITINYKAKYDKRTGESFSKITEQSYTFTTNSLNALTKTLALSTLYDLTAYTNVADFNVVQKSSYNVEGQEYVTGDKILLQAEDIEYVYDDTTKKGTLTVVYGDYNYSSFSIRLQNNDPTDPLYVDYTTSNVAVNENANTTTLTYYYADMQTHLFNLCGWLFLVDMSSDCFTVDTDGADGVNVAVLSDRLTVTFNNKKENSLAYVDIQGVAEIMEDVECSVTYEYAHLFFEQDGSITEETITGQAATMMYSDTLNYTYVDFMNEYGADVLGALEMEILEGNYYEPINIVKSHSNIKTSSPTFHVKVVYAYNTLFKIQTVQNGNVLATKYKTLNDTTNLYYGSQLVQTSDIPSGWRVLSMESSNLNVRINNAEDYTQTTLTVNTDTNTKEILPVIVTLTDKWNVVINYFETYKNTPFALKKQAEVVVNMATYPDIYALTLNDVGELISLADLTVCGMVYPDKLTKEHIKFDNVSTYTVTLTYGHSSLRQIDYDGHAKEIQIPLTSYVDWCASFGAEWSILFLNTEEHTYFNFSNDIKREDLYGFFSQAVFKEQVSDLNRWFKNNTGAGRMTIFSQKQANGWGIYRFFDRMTTKDPFLAVLGFLGMAFCEVLDDSNAVYYSYYFYLDGSVPNGYAFTSNGGADDAFDDDTALENGVEDVGDAIGNIFDGIKDWIKNLGIWDIFGIVSGGVVLVGGGFLIVWALKKLGFIGNGTSVQKKRANGSKRKTMTRKRK